MSSRDVDGLGGASQRLPVRQWSDAGAACVRDDVAVEVPVALVINGEPFAVMLASPLDLEDFALGFCLTEGIVATPAQFQGVEVVPEAEGFSVYVSVPRTADAPPAARERAIAGRTGCGLCGTRMIEDAIRPAPPVRDSGPFPAAAVQAGLRAVAEAQELNRRTGAVHAAAWLDAQGRVLALREDVGRHNALDKLIGALVAAGTDPSSGFVLVTSRASYEMVHKAAVFGTGLLVAVSAPTALAVRMAEAANLTLVGFARLGRHSTYTHPTRIVD